MSELEIYISSYFGVEQKDLQTLSSLFKTEQIKKGDYFLKTGKSCDKLSFIKSGYLRIYVDKEKKEITQWISSQGYFVTDLSSLVFDSPARWNIQALSDVELYTIEKHNYKKIGTLISKWHELEKLFIAKCFSMLEDRIFSHLSMTAEERYLFFYEKNKELFNQVPLQYLASMLGMTPETISRIRKKTLS
ncbi:Crp/Fnr family transcriptional regulator [Aurantibacillus circumpalustris]|uniref:Crp/Fnr family transcriptional regulator n=1 Tax=Aurantibacillus circumpalustris TaxID=3036359 RepID=UPI00295C2931|nr:Crp/Fnr family transcriptional regulator [Aurantibacillus circumpalustris]